MANWFESNGNDFYAQTALTHWLVLKKAFSIDAFY